MPCVSCRCTQMYKIRVGSITSTKPAYMVPYCAALCWACIRFSRPTGRVRGALVVAGWKMTGQLAGLGIMLLGVALLLAVLAIYNATYQD